MRWRGEELRAVLRRLCRPGAVLSLVLLAGFGLVSKGDALRDLRAHPYFRVERIVIRGADRLLSERDLRAWIGIEEGVSLWDVDPRHVGMRLEKNPFVAFAAVRRVFPGVVEIRVRERRPEAIAVLDDLYYLDRRGRAFGPLLAHHSRDFPVVTGPAAGMSEGRRRWLVRRIVHLLRSCRDRPCDRMFSELHLSPANGLVAYPIGPAVPLMLGWSAWSAKVELAGRVLDDWRDRPGRIVRIDVRFRGQVIVALHADERVAAGKERRARDPAGPRRLRT